MEKPLLCSELWSQVLSHQIYFLYSKACAPSVFHPGEADVPLSQAACTEPRSHCTLTLHPKPPPTVSLSEEFRSQIRQLPFPMISSLLLCGVKQTCTAVPLLLSEHPILIYGPCKLRQKSFRRVNVISRESRSCFKSDEGPASSDHLPCFVPDTRQTVQQWRHLPAPSKIKIISMFTYFWLLYVDFKGEEQRRNDFIFG